MLHLAHLKWPHGINIQCVIYGDFEEETTTILKLHYLAPSPSPSPEVASELRRPRE